MNDKTVRDAVLDTILEQINNGAPPEARATYDRLIEGGASNSQALHFMAKALREEMTKMLSEGTPFDDERYSVALRKIPAGNG